MSSPEDFDRVGELLGDAWERAASPDPRGSAATDGVGGRSGAGGEGRGIGRDGPAATRAPHDLARMIAESWAEVVGPEVAENATPVRLTRGSLVVSTSSSVWADTLRYMSTELVARLNERVGEDAVSEMVFRHAGWEERPRPGSPSGARVPAERRPLTEEEEQAVAEVEQYDLPPGLRHRATQAMRRALERQRRDPVR